MACGQRSKNTKLKMGLDGFVIIRGVNIKPILV